MDKALRDKGLANRKAVLGEDYVNKAIASADSFNSRSRTSSTSTAGA